MADPDTDPPEPSRDRVSDDVAALSELIAAGVEVDGEAQVAESTWVLYGHTSYDGEMIVGEYQDSVEASEVLRAIPRPDPDPDHDGPAR
jgi:hypothetical protein